MTEPRPSPPDEAPIMIEPDMLETSDSSNGRIDFEQRMSFLPALTIVLILLNAAVFAWELSSGALADEKAIINAGALHRERVLEGEVWRMVTATFLHGGPEYLLGNCLMLFILGMACEHAFGVPRAAAIYLTAGLCGSLLSLAMQPGPSVGASGAIFGVAGAMVAFFYRHQRAVTLRDKRIGFVLLIWAAYQIVTGMFNPMIDNFAHVGGFLGGAAVSLCLRPAILSRAAPIPSDLPSPAHRS